MQTSNRRAAMLILASPVKWGWNPLSWEIIPRVHIGPLAISPHGVGIALGFLVGAQVMVRRARRHGGPHESHIWNILFWGLLGAIVGARLAYVIGHWSQVTDGGNDILGIFKVWQGGISLLGGIIGGIVAGLPYARKYGLGFWRMLDLVAPCLALGIAIGRIGDLIIGDHLGKPTSFVLGWRCLSQYGGVGAQSAAAYKSLVANGNPPSLGCFDIALHQTALYDFISSWILFGVLVWIGRRARPRGMLACIFGLWYGGMRVVTDFLRVDKRYFGLTGSQITAIVVCLACIYLLARYRGAPPRFAEPPPPWRPDPTAESSQDSEKAEKSASADYEA